MLRSWVLNTGAVGQTCTHSSTAPGLSKATKMFPSGGNQSCRARGSEEGSSPARGLTAGLG